MDNPYFLNYFLIPNHIRTIKTKPKIQIFPILDAILAIYNTPMNIYHCFVFNSVYRSCEVLRCRISKRYSKRHFFICLPIPPYLRQTAPAWNQHGKCNIYFLIKQNFCWLFFYVFEHEKFMKVELINVSSI